MGFLLLRIGGGSPTPAGILTKRKALGQGRVGPHVGNTDVKTFLADFEVSCAKAAVVRAAALQTPKVSMTAEGQHSARAGAEDTVLREIGDMGEALIPGTLLQVGSVPPCLGFRSASAWSRASVSMTQCQRTCLLVCTVEMTVAPTQESCCEVAAKNMWGAQLQSQGRMPL